MTRVPDSNDGRPHPDCGEPACGRAAAYWVYRRDAPAWTPICPVHATGLHPSTEIHAWLTSGYLKPVELPRPTTPPAEPSTDRAAAFRRAIDEVMGWSTG